MVNNCGVNIEAIDFLNRLNESGRIDYNHYSYLHDLLTSEAPEPSAGGLAEIIGDVVVDHADTGPHSQRAITIRDTCAAWPDLIAGEVQAHGFRRSLPLSDEALDAAFEAFRKHDRGEEFNEFGEHVCSECGYAYSWPSGVDGRQTVPARRRQRHIAREALRAANEVR